ncbi:hypothetical protein BDA99DRAFT_245203 [Phascolomyces articulosus]|uniref:Uncharacterized protein n=1 Tax=Phascolomyces articulosus TaxID=60185 RepID=A0AAD5K8P1_9FUNG|nr:hypothetical protein BDA99DRAFT_245203 [Phascolomyces articulosus]
MGTPSFFIYSPFNINLLMKTTYSSCCVIQCYYKSLLLGGLISTAPLITTTKTSNITTKKDKILSTSKNDNNNNQQLEYGQQYETPSTLLWNNDNNNMEINEDNHEKGVMIPRDIHQTHSSIQLLCNQPIVCTLGISSPSSPTPNLQQSRRVWNSSNNCLCIRIRTTKVPSSSSRQNPPTKLTLMADAESEEARRAKVLAARKKVFHSFIYFF